MEKNIYNFYFPYDTLDLIIKLKKYNKINIFFDLLSFNKNFYNEDIVHMELKDNLTNKIFLKEFDIFISNILNYYIKLSPKIVLFFDNGGSKQNKDLNKEYKINRKPLPFLSEEDFKKFLDIKRFYYDTIENDFNKKDSLVSLNFKNYESDLLGHYIIKNNFLDSNEEKTINLIISNDKDLTQSCNLNNTIMTSSSFSKYENKTKVYFWNDVTAIEYLTKKKDNGLKSEYVPLILSMAGDVSDNIKNIPKVGYITAVKLIKQYNILPYLNNGIFIEDEKYKNYKQLVLDNLKLTSFDLQIERIDETLLNSINKKLETIF